MMKNIKASGISGSQFNIRVLTCWITKRRRKTTWVKFSVSKF